MNRWIHLLFDALDRGRRFVTRDVWRIGLPGEEIPHGFIIKHIRVVILLVQGLVRDDLLLRASALTFASILAMVPFLAIMFFIIQTFNVGAAIGDLIGPTLTVSSPEAATAPASVAEKNRKLQNDILFLMFGGFERQDASVGSEKVVNPVRMIIEYAERGSNPSTLTLAGVIFVITTVFGLMMNIESSFNTIWGLRRTRSWYRMFSDYMMILILLPFMAAGALSITAVLESSVISQRLGGFAAGLRGIQYVLSWLAFTALYFMVPNTRVRFRYALFAGVVTGTLWCLLSWGYVKFQFGLPRYNLLYVAFAQVPVFLMWVYCSWLVLLGGAELTFAYQNEKTFAMERLAEVASYAYKEAVGVWAMVEMSRRFDAGEPGLTAAAYAKAWNIPTRVLNETLTELEECRLVVQSGANPPTYQPARSIDKITVAEVIACLRESGRNPSALRLDPTFRSVIERIEAHPGGPTACRIGDLVHVVHAAPPESSSPPSA